MRDEGCTVCGKRRSAGPLSTAANGFVITYTDLCDGCAMTLDRALNGIVGMLREAHGEHRERVISKLIGRLNDQGFDTTTFHRRAG